MSTLREAFKAAIRKVINEQLLPKETHPYFTGVVTQINPDGTVQVQDSSGNYSSVLPIYPVASGQQVMVINPRGDKSALQCVPLVPRAPAVPYIHSQLFSGGLPLRFAVPQAQYGVLPLPPQVNPLDPSSTALAVDFQDLGSDKVYRLQFPDLDGTWTFPIISSPTTNGGGTSTTFADQTNWGSGLSGTAGSSPPNLNTQCNYVVPTKVVAFSPNCQVVAIAFTQLNNSAKLLSSNTYANRIRVYSIGSVLTSAGVIDQASNLYALQATLLADYSWNVFGYGITDQYDPNKVPLTNTTVITQWSVPYSLLVTASGDGPEGYGVYWLEYCNIALGAVTAVGGGFVQTWVPSGQYPAQPTPALDPTFLPSSMTPIPHPTTALNPGSTTVYGTNTTLVSPGMALAFLKKLTVHGGLSAQTLSTTLITSCGGQNNVSQPNGAGPAPAQSLTRLLPMDLISINEADKIYLCFALINSSLWDLTLDDPTNNLNQTASTVQFAVVNLSMADPVWETFQTGGTYFVGPGTPGALTPVLWTRPAQGFPTVVWSDPATWVNGYSPVSPTTAGVGNVLNPQDGVYKTSKAWTATVNILTGQPTPVANYFVYLGDLPAKNVSIYTMTVNPIILPYGAPAYNPDITKYNSGYPFSTYFFDTAKTSGFFQSTWYTKAAQSNPTLDQIFTAKITVGPPNVSVTATALPIGSDNTLPTYYNVKALYWTTSTFATRNYNTVMQQSKG